MRLLSLELHDFMSHGSTSLDLRQVPAAIITGANGAGKSSLIDGIAYVLWGETRASLDDVVRLGQTEARGTVTFEVAGAVYRVARSRKVTGRGASLLDLEVEDPQCSSGWRSMAGANLRDTETRIVALVGPYDLACVTWLSRQGQADQFAKATPGERRMVLGQLLGLKRWNQYATTAREQARVAQARVDARDATRVVLEAVAGDLNTRRKALATVNSALEEAKGIEAQATSNADSKAAQVVALLEEHGSIRESRAQYVAKRQETDKANDRLTHLVRELRDLDGQIEVLEATAASIWSPGHTQALAKAREDEATALVVMEQAANRRDVAAEAVREATAQVEAAVMALRETEMRATVAWQREHSTRTEIAARAATAHQVAREAVRLAERAIDDARRAGEDAWRMERQKRLDARSDAIVEVGKARSRLEAARADAALLDRVPFGEKCATAGCGFVAKAAKARTDMTALEAAHTSAEAAESAALATVEECGTQPPPLDAPDLRTALDTALARFAEVEQALSRADAAVVAHGEQPPPLGAATRVPMEADIEAARGRLEEAAKTKQAAVDDYHTATDRRREARLSINGLEDMKKAGEENASKLTEARARLEATRGEFGRVESEFSRLSAETQALEPPAQVQRDLDREVMVAVAARTRAQATAAESRDKVSGAEAVMRGADQDVKASEKAVADLKALDDSTASDRAQVADMTVLAQAYADVPQLIVETVVPDIEGVANRLLAKVSQTGLSISIRTQRALKSEDRLAETLDLVVRDSTGERPYESYSGGERFRIDWSLRVALAHVLSARAGLDLRTMIVDEGFGSLDPAGISGFASTLNATAEMFGLCLVISHVPELAEAFPCRLDVRKGAAGSVAEWVS